METISKGPFLWRVWVYIETRGADGSWWEPVTGFTMTLPEARRFKREIQASHPEASYGIMDFVSKHEAFHACCGASTKRAHFGTCANADSVSAASGCSRASTSLRAYDECTCWDYENPNPIRHSGFCPLAD